MSAAPETGEVWCAPCAPYVPEHVWEAIGDELVEAINVAGALTLDQVRDLVNRERMVLFVAVELGPTMADDRILAGLLCAIEDWSERRVLNVLATGGADFRLWSEKMQAALIEYAREKQCTDLRALCRPGMAKWLRKLGWKSVLQTMELRHGTL